MRDVTGPPFDTDRVIPLLERDVARTVGEAHRTLVRDFAAKIRALALGLMEPAEDDEDDEDEPVSTAQAQAYYEERVVEEVQQYLHDTHADTTWPACPRHPKHPLWYRDGAWWCTADGVEVARLGELPARGRPSAGA